MGGMGGAAMLKVPRENTKIIHYSIPKHTKNCTATHHLEHTLLHTHAHYAMQMDVVLLPKGKLLYLLEELK